jgi:hypothetical protein
MKTDLIQQDNLKENQHVSKESEVKMVAGRVTVFGEGTLEENVNDKKGGEKTSFLCHVCYLQKHFYETFAVLIKTFYLK